MGRRRPRRCCAYANDHGAFRCAGRDRRSRKMDTTRRSARVAQIAVPAMIAAGRADQIKSILQAGLIRQPWDLLLRIPLALAGEPVDPVELEASLKRVRALVIPDAGRESIYGGGGWQTAVFDTFPTGCELGFGVGLDVSSLTHSISRIRSVLMGKSRPIYTSEFQRIDGLLRRWLLERALSSTDCALVAR